MSIFETMSTNYYQYDLSTNDEMIKIATYKSEKNFSSMFGLIPLCLPIFLNNRVNNNHYDIELSIYEINVIYDRFKNVNKLIIVRLK